MHIVLTVVTSRFIFNNCSHCCMTNQLLYFLTICTLFSLLYDKPAALFFNNMHIVLTVVRQPAVLLCNNMYMVHTVVRQTSFFIMHMVLIVAREAVSVIHI